jgi:hypothetical protein
MKTFSPLNFAEVYRASSWTVRALQFNCNPEVKQLHKVTTQQFRQKQVSL